MQDGSDEQFTIESYNQALNNAIRFQEIRFSDNSNAAMKMLGRFYHWYYFPHIDSFAPSKFIGYKNTSISSYKGGDTGDGRETQAALKKLFIKLDPADDDTKALEAQLRDFISEIKTRGSGLSKRFEKSGGIYIPSELSDAYESGETNLSPTEQMRTNLARKGQGSFRKRLLENMRHCQITGIDDMRLLIASHIKPWSECSSVEERLSEENGLLLAVHLDKLFDQGYITFSDTGLMKCASALTSDLMEKLGITDEMRNTKIRLSKKRRKYMKFHRTNVFMDNAKNIGG